MVTPAGGPVLIAEETAIERIVEVLTEQSTWLPGNPYGVAALILDALQWPRADGSIPESPSQTRPANSGAVEKQCVHGFHWKFCAECYPRSDHAVGFGGEHDKGCDGCAQETQSVCKAGHPGYEHRCTFLIGHSRVEVVDPGEISSEKGEFADHGDPARGAWWSSILMPSGLA